MADSKASLFSEFPKISTQEWTDQILSDLKGADFDKKLVWKTAEGFNVKPFYRKEDTLELETTHNLPGTFPFLRGNKTDDNTWLIRQNIAADHADAANRKALELLNKGIDSLGFHIKAENVNSYYIETLLEGICCNCIELNFTTCQRHSQALADILTDYFAQKGYKPEEIHASLNFDPVAKMLQKGKDLSSLTTQAAKLAEKLSAYPYFQCIGVNAVHLNNAGAYIYQELGYALAWGAEYMTLLTDAGIPAGTAAGKIKFNFGIGSNYFMEIAKFRAARLLWANIVKAYSPETDENCRMNIHAETSMFNQTLFDAHVNLLRTQTEAMSAALAGVDSITVLPFDSAYEIPDDFSERLARNQQLLLKEEAHLNRVVDPAGGSYYIECLTDSIARQAWNLFLETDRRGGMLKAILQGQVQQDINRSNRQRHEAVSKRKEILLGTNQYPNFNEQAGSKNPVAPGCGCGHHHSEPSLEKLCTERAASEFETLRLETEHSGKRPKAFMLTIGNLAMRQARAQFSCNFLACAGYQVIDNLGFESVEEGVKAAINAEADIVVLCSSDEEYEQYALPAFRAINGRALFIVAGAPACMDSLKQEGIEHFIHIRCNILDTLRNFNKILL